MKRVVVRLVVPFLVAGIILGGMLVWLSSPARADEQSSTNQTVTVVGKWAGVEQESFQAVLDEFTSLSGITVSYSQTNNIRELLLSCSDTDSCPDVAIVPNPGILSELESQDALVALDPMLPDFDTYYTTTWRSLGSVGDTLYGLPFKAGSKSIIWYRPEALDAISATVPLSWTALLNLSDDLVANGQIPFSIGAESGGASGWPLTDWFENILVRVGGTEVHRKLVSHDIPWTHPTVVEAMDRFSDIVGQEAYQVGGISGTLTTNFIDAIDLVYMTPPSGTMYFEGFWVQGVISDHFPSLTPVVDYNLFDFPEIDPTFGQPLVGAADFVIMFHDTSDAQMLMQFLVTPDAAEVWAARGGGYFSPNSGVELNTYPDELSRQQAEQLMNTNDFVFDLDDQLPSALQIEFWHAMMDFVAHQDQTMSILQGIEDLATELQGYPYESFLPVMVKH